MDEKEPSRRPAMKVPDWWLAAIARARVGVSNIKIAELTSGTLGRTIDDSQVSRCINVQAERRVAPIDLVEAISDLFDVPRPVWFCATEDEARRFKTQRKISGLQDKRNALAGEAADLSNRRQHGAIQVPDGEKPAARVPRGVDRGRGKAPAR